MVLSNGWHSWLHYLVSGAWDKKVQSSTDEYVREAFLVGLQTFTSSSSDSAAAAAALANAITAVTDSPLTQEHDSFIKHRGLLTLSQTANTVCIHSVLIIDATSHIILCIDIYDMI